MAKPGCPEKCRNVSIPYPFGIGPGCNLDTPVEVKCKRSSNSTFNPSLRRDVLEITLDYVRVKSVAYSHCFNKLRKEPKFMVTYDWGKQFRHSETKNKLIAIGCNIFAYMTDPKTVMYFSGCASLCNRTSNIVSGPPSGQATIPKDLTSFDLYIDRLNPMTWGISPNSSCGIAFLADKNFNRFDIFTVSNYYNGQAVHGVPVVLDWAVGNTSCHQAATTESCACKQNSNCIETSHGLGYQCVGIVAGILILIAIGFWLYHLLNKRKRDQLKHKFFKRNGGLLLQQQISSTEGNVEKTKLYSKEDLEKATDNFNASRVLGKGVLGTAYKGMLSDGSIVAVKKSNIVDENQVAQFINKVIILSQINHRNIVKLLGCCLQTKVPLLVYEYVSNGTLSHHLHDKGSTSKISWNKRLQIVGEITEALAYLHSYTSTAIFHRDIKSTNILLDENYRAMVSDFGLSRSIPAEIMSASDLGLWCNRDVRIKATAMGSCAEARTKAYAITDGLLEGQLFWKVFVYGCALL
ncbi:hypothetical protein F0562_013592 [Nyssa sinensis]|uniref:Protein kinase domain-containing protein n=1 Tax=Nyssa sinensis TaxID=561372 RepID=A0A5J4ZNQ9_9ASTE|nr:hypothetical protein F0562_013592 [Nyssa sinensis]